MYVVNVKRRYRKKRTVLRFLLTHTGLEISHIRLNHSQTSFTLLKIKYIHFILFTLIKQN